MGIMDPEKIMDNWFKSVSYDKTGDWKKTPETDEDPEDDGDQPRQIRMFGEPDDESDDGQGGPTDESDDDQGSDYGDESNDGNLRPKLSIDEVKNLWDGSKQTREKIAEIVANNHGDNIHFPTDIKWDGLSRHMKLMAVHAMSDLGHDFEHLDKMPKLAKKNGNESDDDDWDPDSTEIKKSHISRYIRHTKTGMLVPVHEHDDSRTKRDSGKERKILQLMMGDSIDKSGNIRVSPNVRRAIIDSFFYGKKPAKEMGEVQHTILTGGLPGAGKSSNIMESRDKYVVSDPDQVKNATGYHHFASYVHSESSDINNEIKERALQGGYHCIFDSTMTHYPTMDRAIQKTLQNGGKVAVRFTNVDYITSAARAKARELTREPRRIPDEVVLNGYNSSLPTFMALYYKYKENPRVAMSLVDNNVDFGNPIPIFDKDKHGIKILDEERFKALMKIKVRRTKDENGDICYERKEKATTDDLKRSQREIKLRTRKLVAAYRRA